MRFIGKTGKILVFFSLLFASSMSIAEDAVVEEQKKQDNVNIEKNTEENTKTDNDKAKQDDEKNIKDLLKNKKPELLPPSNVAEKIDNNLIGEKKDEEKAENIVKKKESVNNDKEVDTKELKIKTDIKDVTDGKKNEENTNLTSNLPSKDAENAEKIVKKDNNKQEKDKEIESKKGEEYNEKTDTDKSKATERTYEIGAKKKRKTKDKLFTIFDTKKALNFNYKNVKADNYEFLENAKELIVIKELIEEQLNPEIKKKKEEEKKKQETLVSIVEKVKEKGKVYNYLRLHSLVFLSDKDWNCRVNKQIIDYKNKDNLKSDVISILRVSKGSVVFVVNNTDDKLVKKVQKLIENKVPYSSSYFIVKQHHKTYVAFKLFIGQKINLDTMKISG